MADLYEEQTPAEVELQFRAPHGEDDARVARWYFPSSSVVRRLVALLREAPFTQRLEVDVVQGGDQHIRLGGGEEVLVVGAR